MANIKSKGGFKQAVLPSGIFAFALLLNLATVWSKNFDGLYGQDAYSYFAHANELRFHLTLLHHWQWEVGPRLLYWPFGYPATLALFFLLTGATAGAAQLSSMLAWAGTCALLTALGRKFSGSWLGGGVAGGLLALSPLGRQLAISVMADATATFWVVLMVWLIVKGRESGRGWYLVAAGITLSLATITRYASATALPLLILGAVWPLPSGKVFSGSKELQNFELATSSKSQKITLNLKWLILATIAGALLYLPQFVINQLNPAAFWTDSWLSDWSPLSAVHSHFNTRDGLAVYATPPLVFYLFYGLLNLHLLTALALPLVALGLLHLVQPRHSFTLVFLLTWWLVPVLFLSGIPYENERFMLTFLPPLALLSAAGVVGLANYLPLLKPEFKPKSWRKIVLGTVLIAGALGLGLLSQVHLNGFMAVKASDLATVQQVEQKLPPRATLLTFGLSLTFDHYTALNIKDLSFLDAPTIANLSRQPAVFLLADSQNMQQQWAGHPTGIAFQTALAHADSTPLGHFGAYTLWKLGL